MGISVLQNNDLNAATPMVSGVTVNTAAIDCSQAFNVSVQFNTESRGTPTFAGTVALQASNDNGDNYVALSGYATNFSGTGSKMLRVTTPDFQKLRAQYTNVAGSGLLEVWPFVKTEV